MTHPHTHARQVIERMRELSEYFTGQKALARVSRDENLMRWFEAEMTVCRKLGRIWSLNN